MIGAGPWIDCRRRIRRRCGCALRDAGVEDRAIADIVGVDPVALATLMEVAEAKLAAASIRDGE
ncbi:MAG TPA: hypothetical protein VIW24_08305 [Aldersonia sp.]